MDIGEGPSEKTGKWTGTKKKGGGKGVYPKQLVEEGVGLGFKSRGLWQVDVRGGKTARFRGQDARGRGSVLPSSPLQGFKT